MPPLPPPFREHLMPTEPEAVDAAIIDAVRAFCEESPEIEAAYVCAAEREREGEDSEHVLRLSVKLVAPVDGSDAGREQRFKKQLPLIERFAHAHPDVMRELGFGVLTDAGVPAFERNGVTLYRRIH
jgi:hypothetical protein